ncbi:MAG TPA: hypothetical protein VG097_18195 [Gemmata sp.]|jgi:hypothetical protein|nr:hypothetical protein [Gemmata sp.]
MIAFLARTALLFSFFGIAGTAFSQPQLPPLPPPDEKPPLKQEQAQPGVKVADKGPIHEAFAQPGAEVRGKDMTAPKAPPPPVNEAPPESKPEGANVKWIPGYWQWDEHKNDFIWVSGFYRNVPPNRAWEPGKWIEKDGKNVYTPGFWRPTDTTTWKDVFPEPPKSVENGPSTPNENPNAMWVPGGWEYRNNEFVWRSGYWAAPYRDLMWQPSQYVYNGSGYNYIPGYWDYPLENRGLLNAPVYIDPQFVQNSNWSFTPQYGIGAGDANGWGNGGLFESMYVGPNYNNYYYGNYGDPFGLGGLGFGSGYGEPLYGYGGYIPWWGFGNGFYNPLWNHYNWLNRNNRGWGEGIRAGRNGARGGLNGAGTRSNANRGLGAVTGGAGFAAQNAGRAALSTRSGSFVQPASQVLANQAVRASSFGVGANGGVANSGAIIRSSGIGIQPGTTYGGTYGSSMHGVISQPGVHSYGGSSGVHGTTTYYHGSSGGGVRASGGRSGGGGGGRGGHR